MHVRQYFPGSFAYFGQPAYQNADCGYRGDWEIVQLVLAVGRARYEGKSHADIWHDVMSLSNVVRELQVELRAVKPIRKQSFELIGTLVAEFAFVD